MTVQIGKDELNNWQYDPQTSLMDLTGGATTPTNLTLQTTTHPIRLNADTTALVVIDMQNFFLHPALRRPAGSGKEEPTLGETAASKLLDTGIPAARAHGIRVIWLNWGLTEEDLSTMPPSVMRTFGSFPIESSKSSFPVPSELGMIRVKDPSLYRGLGTDIGDVEIGQGESVQGGRILMRGSWNSSIYGPLEEDYQRHQHESKCDKGDVIIHKNRTSGLSGTGSDLENFLRSEGITTLLFAGVNTDQCVGSTLMDAYSKGYDCVLLRDATATGSPFGAQKVWEWNVANALGFVTTCEALKGGK